MIDAAVRHPGSASQLHAKVVFFFFSSFEIDWQLLGKCTANEIVQAASRQGRARQTWRGDHLAAAYPMPTSPDRTDHPISETKSAPMKKGNRFPNAEKYC